MASNLFKVYNERVATASCPHVNVFEWRVGSSEFNLDWPNIIAACITKYWHCVICDKAHVKTT